MSKILTLEEAIYLRKNLKTQNKTLVTTNGTFDIIHPAHISILEQAKQQGDYLLVLLNSDLSVKQNKDPKRPIFQEGDRVKILSALSAVDYILLFNDKEVLPTLEQIKPDIHIKGGSWIPERIKSEKEIIEKYNGRHICLPQIGGYSTTSIIEEILKRYCPNYQSNNNPGLS